MRRPLLCAVWMLSAGLASAQTPPIRPGLWETTPRETLMDGKPLPQMGQLAAQLDKLPPEMRAQMKARMQAQGVDFGNGSVRHCVSAEMLRQNRWSQAHEGCEMTVLDRSNSSWRVKGHCSRNNSDVEAQTRFDGDTAYHSEVRVSSQREGKPHLMTSKVDAKWISADCGALKPMAAPAPSSK